MDILLLTALLICLIIIILIGINSKVFEVDPTAGLGAVVIPTVPLTVDATVLQAYAGGASGAQGIPGAQTSYPRNVKYVHTGANSGSYTVTITGTTADGATGQTEDISVTGAGTFQGVKAWSWITDVDLGAGINVADSAELQEASKIGIPFSIFASADVLHVVKNSTGVLPTAFTIDTTNNTIEETIVAVAALDEYWYYVRHHGAI